MDHHLCACLEIIEKAKAAIKKHSVLATTWDRQTPPRRELRLQWLIRVSRLAYAVAWSILQFWSLEYRQVYFSFSTVKTDFNKTIALNATVARTYAYHFCEFISSVIRVQLLCLYQALVQSTTSAHAKPFRHQLDLKYSTMYAIGIMQPLPKITYPARSLVLTTVLMDLHQTRSIENNLFPCTRTFRTLLILFRSSG